MNKEELKDEMKNRISLALKDPILQQGFEIICKENEELKNKLTEKVTLESLEVVSARMEELEGQVTRAFEVLEIKRKRIEKLEQENAELKTLIKSEHEIEARKNNRLISQLTKAKELLQRVVKWATTETCKCEKFDFILADAKQFLNSEVEK